MQKQIISTNKAPQPIGPYNQAVSVSNGKLIYTAGQIPFKPETNTKISGSIEDECVQVLNNIKSVVEAAGASLADVIKVTVFLKNLDDFKKFNSIYKNYFPETYPARSVVEVSRLPGDVSLEVEVIAWMSDEE